jgi:aryl-alcohol dehydrogenase-like predicted oxidoreductase
VGTRRSRDGRWILRRLERSRRSPGEGGARGSASEGITHWDTADAYGHGHAEQLIGQAFAEGVPRKDIFLASKFGFQRGGADHFYDPTYMREQCEISLRDLQTDVIDLYYFHHCDFGPNDVYFDDALENMRRFRDEGKIRFIGLSDWDARKIMKFIDRVDPDVVQPFRNIIDDAYESSVG